MFIHEDKKYKKAGIQKRISMDGGWGWGERAAPIPDPPIQAFLFLNTSVFYTFLSSRINDPKASLWLGLMDVNSLDARFLKVISFEILCLIYQVYTVYS